MRPMEEDVDLLFGQIMLIRPWECSPSWKVERIGNQVKLTTRYKNVRFEITAEPVADRDPDQSARPTVPSSACRTGGIGMANDGQPADNSTGSPIKEEEAR